jgi:uncharacterized protein
MNTMERKSYDIELKSLDDKGRFSGYGTTWGNVDREGDVVVKGAFEESLAEHKAAGTLPSMYFNHDAKLQCGDWLSMVEDQKGLLVEGQLWLGQGIPCAEQAYRMLKGTGVKGLSNGFITRKKSASPPKGVRKSIEKAELIETSLTSIPMNTRALVTSVKSMDVITLKDAEEILRDAGFSISEAKAFISGLKKGLEPARDEQADAALEALTKLAQRTSR